jgi:hypothetical protein
MINHGEGIFIVGDSSVSLRMTGGAGYCFQERVIPTGAEGSVVSPERFFGCAQKDTWPGGAFGTCHPDSFDCAKDRLRGGICLESERFFGSAQNDRWQGTALETCHPDRSGGIC